MTVKVDMHVGDYGTIFEMTILNRTTNKALSLAGATDMLFLFQPPLQEESFIREAIISSPPGTNGKLKYIFEDGDIYIAGEWKVQALVRGVDGQWHTDIEIFQVGENIATPSSG